MSPLGGRRIVVTRGAAQAGELMERLRAAGAAAVALPTIASAPPARWEKLDRAVRGAEAYGGFIFTSGNGARAFFERAETLGAEPRRRPGSWVCAIGAATAAALPPGWEAELLPSAAVGEAVAAAVLAGLAAVAGERILLPCAAGARRVIAEALERRGAAVEMVEAYRTVVPAGSQELAEKVFAEPVDAVVFASSSTARHLALLLGERYRERLAGAKLAALGPVTAATLRELGLEADIESAHATMAALVTALEEHFRHA